MKLTLCITSALVLLAASSAYRAEHEIEEVFKIPIVPIRGARQPSTIGRWEHTLRKYGVAHGQKSEGARGKSRVVLETGKEASLMAQIPLIDYDFDREYYGAVQVGEPPQTFKIDFDTGSSKFILSSKACKDCSGSTRFDPAASHTFRLNNEYENELGNKNSSSTFTSDPNTWHITYGDMSHAEGILGRDHVTIANLTVRHQQIALILSESANFDDVVDGIMGLSFGTLSSPSSHPQSFSTQGPPEGDTPLEPRTLFENMMDQGLVKHGVFSFYLGKNYPNGTSDPIDSGSDYTGGGEVIFGGVDTSRVREGFEIVYTPVTKPKYWQINIENIFVAGQRVDYYPEPTTVTSAARAVGATVKTSSKESTANRSKGQKRGSFQKNNPKKQSNIVGIMDTGTTLMIVPERLAFAVHQLIPGAVQISGQSWTIPCDLTSTTSSFSSSAKNIKSNKSNYSSNLKIQGIELEIEGHRFAIPFSDLVREAVRLDGQMASGIDKGNGRVKKEDRDQEQSNNGKNQTSKDKVSVVPTQPRLCFSGIQPSAANFMIIGDLFIKNNYVVFDQANQRVGIAPLKFPSLTKHSSSSKNSSYSA
ncbi:hypothetical protein BX616_010676 [Lobosporangium transversale]|nr:hypothetical protein BX616_010676 [Lobosporangium transversale]